MKILLIPDWQGCTIITDNGYCTIQGLPNDIVDKVFVSEIPISNGIGLITPLVNELTIRFCEHMLIVEDGRQAGFGVTKEIFNTKPSVLLKGVRNG
jgi:hypothetical protein